MMQVQWVLLLAIAAAAPAAAQGPVPGAGRPAIDPFTARPGVTAPDRPLYDPVTGLPTQPRTTPQGRGAARAPYVPADPFATLPGQPPRTGYNNAPPPIDPLRATPGVQQMRPGTYDTYAPSSPGTTQSPRPGAAGTIPGAQGAYTPGTSYGPGGSYGAVPRPLDPYGGRSDDKYSYGRR